MSRCALRTHAKCFAFLPIGILLVACGASEDVRQGGTASSDAASDSRDEVAEITPIDEGARDVLAEVPGMEGAPNDVAGGDAPGEAMSCGKFSGPGLLTFNLTNAPFPNSGYPDVAVHIPAGFDPCHRPGVIVFFHGFDNCVVNVVGTSPTACTSDGGLRASLHLNEQLDAAHVNAILVAVELQVDVASGNPGQLTNPGRFHDLLHELFADHLNPLLGQPLDLPDIDRVVVAAFNGGYQAAAAVIEMGGVSQLSEVDLYDSLFGNVTSFETWIQSNVSRFDATAINRTRFVDLYTAGGGTLTNSQSMVARLSGFLGDAGLSSSTLDARAGVALSPSDLSHPIIFGLVPAPSDDLVKSYFGLLAQSSGFAALP